MNVFLIAALTADGFIAKNNNHFINWSTKEDKQFFLQKTKEAGVVIVGGNTFRTFPSPLEDRLNIVYTSKPQLLPQLPHVRATQLPPDKLISTLIEEGYQTAAVIGGSSIYTQFMQHGLIDTLYLSIEPILFGQGISLFNRHINQNISLNQVHTLSTQTIVMEYSVTRSSPPQTPQP